MNSLEIVEGDKQFLGDVEILGEINNPSLKKVKTDLQVARGEAQLARASIQDFLSTILADSIIDVQEKKVLRAQWREIESEYPIVRQRALDSGIGESETAVQDYATAYAALHDYLYTNPGILQVMSLPAPVNPSTAAAVFAAYFAAREVLVSGALAQAVATTSHIFYEEPVGPYAVGDLWISNGILYQSTVARSPGEFVLADWIISIQSNFIATIQSTNGDKFKPGYSTTTVLIPHVFKNAIEVTDTFPDSAFRWKRRSLIDTSGDALWNANHASGYRTVEVNTDSIYARAVYTLEIDI